MISINIFGGSVAGLWLRPKMSAVLLAVSLLFTTALTVLVGCAPAEPEFDVVILNGVMYDGSGQLPQEVDIGVTGDRITSIGDLSEATAKIKVDATGKAVSPGFINMLSWATTSLLHDGKSQSDIRQGVTLEVMGEGWSMGPWNDAMKAETLESQGDITYDIEWTTLGEYLTYLEDKGVSTNVASFVGATTVRIHELGYEDRRPTNEELGRMKSLVAQAMEEGALGVGSSLIYAPAFYADTDELIELCSVASGYGGMYISHIRSEGDYWLEAITELIQISKQANIAAEIYHLKAGGESNWSKYESAIALIDSARGAGLKITTDMYTYIAGATGLDASMPPWVQEGGYDAWAERLKEPDVREKVIREMKARGDGWENLYFAAGSPERMLLVGFRNDSLKYLTGKTLAEVAELRDTGPEETAIDLVVQDGSRVGTVYFLMSEENIRKQVALPYMSFGSDAESMAPEGDFLKSNPHPRAYGNFARLLGKYVREESVISLQEAIYKLTGLPASNLGVKDRGMIKEGFFADLVVFDPETITDHATFDSPHQYATGVQHVFVNGVQVLSQGEHTGALPGKFVKGPGYVTSTEDSNH